MTTKKRRAKAIKKRRVDKGTIIDRLVTPYVIWTHLPTQTKYVEFPFGFTPSIFQPSDPIIPTIPDYQQKKYYSDERPIKYEDFKKMCRGNFIKELL